MVTQDGLNSVDNSIGDNNTNDIDIAVNKNPPGNTVLINMCHDAMIQVGHKAKQLPTRPITIRATTILFRKDFSWKMEMILSSRF